MGLVRQLATKGVKRIFAAYDYEVVRRKADIGPQLDLLHLAIEHSLAIGGPRSVLQIGANDGVMDDPIRESIIRWKLPALLVEPQPDFFARLQANYNGQPQVAFENAAVGTTRGEATLYRLTNDSALPPWAHGLASFDRRVIMKHRSWPELRGIDIEKLLLTLRVPVVTVADLLAKYPRLSPVLVLQIDTEGHDYHVLQSASAAGCLPPIVNYEHIHLSYGDQVATRELLMKHGYGFSAGDSNTLAMKRP